MRGFLIVMAFVLVAGQALAKCERPVKPAFPDPKTADPAVVEKLATKMEAYSTAVTTYVECLTDEAQAVQQEGAATITAYNNQFLAEYNKRATK